MLSASVAQSGSAPMAARSLRFTARQRWPSGRGRRAAREMHAFEDRIRRRDEVVAGRQARDGRIVADAEHDIAPPRAAAA